MEHLKLNQHKFKKGKFISPWNDMDFRMTQNPWFQNRLPEYLWLALILNKYDRKQGLDVCNSIMLFVKELKINSLSISEILNVDDERQAKLWAKVEVYHLGTYIFGQHLLTINIVPKNVRPQMVSNGFLAVDYDQSEVTVGIENDEMGAYITYERNTLPDFVIWKMMGESEYVVGLEPRITALGGKNIADNNQYVTLKPFCEYKTKVKFEFKRRLINHVRAKCV